MSSQELLRRNLESLQRILKPVDRHWFESSSTLAYALDWANLYGIKFVWYLEDDEGRTYNGLSLCDQQGNVLLRDIAMFASADERLIQEAISAHTLMYNELINPEDLDDVLFETLEDDTDEF